MRTHDDRMLLNAYIDGELDPAHALEVERRLADDPELAAERARIEALRRVIAERLPREAASPELRRRVAALPLPFREALVLRDLQELDYREIAEVMKVPIGTVMSRLARARRRLIAGIATDA